MSDFDFRGCENIEELFEEYEFDATTSLAVIGLEINRQWRHCMNTAELYLNCYRESNRESKHFLEDSEKFAKRALYWNGASDLIKSMLPD